MSLIELIYVMFKVFYGDWKKYSEEQKRLELSFVNFYHKSLHSFLSEH